MQTIPEDIVKIVCSLAPDCRAVAITCMRWYNVYVTTDDYLFWSRLQTRASYALPKMVPSIFGDLFQLAFAGNGPCVRVCFELAHKYCAQFKLEKPKNGRPTIMMYGNNLAVESCVIVELYDRIGTEAARGDHWQLLAQIMTDSSLTVDEKKHIILRALAAHGTTEVFARYIPDIQDILKYIGIAIENENVAAVEYIIFYAHDNLDDVDYALSSAIEHGSVFAAKCLKKHFKIYPHHTSYALMSNNAVIINEICGKLAPMSAQTRAQFIHDGKFTTLLMVPGYTVEQLWRDLTNLSPGFVPYQELKKCTDEQIRSLLPIPTNSLLRKLLCHEIIRRNDHCLLQLIHKDIPRICPGDSLLYANVETLRTIVAAGVPQFAMKCSIEQNISTATINFAVENEWKITPGVIFSYNRDDIEHILNTFPSILTNSKYKNMRKQILTDAIKLPNFHNYTPITRKWLYTMIMCGRMDVATYIADRL